MKKILFVTNDSWFFVSHRLPIATSVLRNGMQPVVVAKQDTTSEKIISEGVAFVPWNISPRGKSIFGELKSIVSLWKIIASEKPDLVHLITLKPVIYGGIVARLQRVPSCVYAVSGLGSVFSAESMASNILRLIIKPFYSFAIGHKNSLMIFQNPSDKSKIKKLFSVTEERTVVVPGSGVDLKHFEITPERTDKVVVTLASRLLKDKGIREFIEAVKILKALGCEAEFQISGSNAGAGNPSAFSDTELKELSDNPEVKMLGHCDDIPTLFANSSLVVLPSYREGLPKVLLEAAAAGRAVITSDVPGCRDAVVKDKTAILVPSKDAKSLADAMLQLIDDPDLRTRYGEAGRLFVQESMTIEKIVGMHMTIYNQLLDKAK